MGNRIAKHVYGDNNNLQESTYYLLDAQGNTISTYEHKIDKVNETITFAQTEKHIYGSSRLGVMNVEIPLLGSQNDTYSQTRWTHTIGARTYEISNHLGNVLSVISDKPIPHDAGGAVDYYLADLRSSQDYSPFGVTLKERTFTLSGAEGYRYTFNGMEKDDEIKGRGNSYDFGARMYDSRLGRWFTIDPLAGKYPSISPYTFVANSPLMFVDPDGKKIVAYDEYSKTKVLSYLTDQFGDGIFRFNRKGILKVNKRACRAFLASATTTDIQRELIEAFKEVIAYEKVYQAYVFEEANKVNIYRNPQQVIGKEVVGEDVNGKAIVRDKIGPIYQQKDGKPGITFKGAKLDGGGSAVFGLKGIDPFIIIADKEASMDRTNSTESDAGGGDETKANPCASCVFVHEFLDHIYSEDMKSADINRPKSEKVKYHNKALENKGSKPRSASDHK